MYVIYITKLYLSAAIQTGEKRTVLVITTAIKMKAGPCNITVTNPKGRSTNLKTKQVTEGFETVFSPWDSGVHKITIEYAGKEVPGSPFEVDVFKINLSAIFVTGLEKRKLFNKFYVLVF